MLRSLLLPPFVLACGLALSAPSSVLNSQPYSLIVTRAFKASLEPGALLNVGEQATVKKRGAIALALPFEAGVYTAFECSAVKLRRLNITESGGLVSDIRLSQRLFCPARARAEFNYRSPNNSTTRYELHSGRNFATITGTKGGVVYTDSVSYFAVSEGQIEVVAESGDTGVVNAGEMAIASANGLQITDIPPLEYLYQRFDRSHGRITFAEPHSVRVDGRAIESGAVVWDPRIVEVTNLLGDSRKSRVNQWLWID